MNSAWLWWCDNSWTVETVKLCHFVGKLVDFLGKWRTWQSNLLDIFVDVATQSWKQKKITWIYLIIIHISSIFFLLHCHRILFGEWLKKTYTRYEYELCHHNPLNLLTRTLFFSFSCNLCMIIFFPSEKSYGKAYNIALCQLNIYSCRWFIFFLPLLWCNPNAIFFTVRENQRAAQRKSY